MPTALQAISLGVIILFAVIAMPVVVDSSTGETTETVVLDENATERVFDQLDITADNIEQSTTNNSANATITIEDAETVDSQTQTVDVGNTANFSLSGGSINVTVTQVTDTTPETVTMDVEASTTYGWSDGAQTIAENLGLVIITAVFITIVALLASVIS